MTDQSDNQLIADLARDIIAQTAPQELPLFRAHSEAYFKNPDKALANIKPMEDMLGFGLGEVVTFMTPIALAVVTQVLKYLAEQVVKTVKDEGGGLASDAVKRLIKRFRPAEQGGQKNSPPLSPGHCHIWTRLPRQGVLNDTRIGTDAVRYPALS